MSVCGTAVRLQDQYTSTGYLGVPTFPREPNNPLTSQPALHGSHLSLTLYPLICLWPEQASTPFEKAAPLRQRWDTSNWPAPSWLPQAAAFHQLALLQRHPSVATRGGCSPWGFLRLRNLERGREDIEVIGPCQGPDSAASAGRASTPRVRVFKDCRSSL